MIQEFFVPIAGRQIDAAGNFFRYESAGLEGNNPAIRLRIDGNDAGTMLPGDALEIPGEARRWELTPGNCSAVVKVGFGRITTVRSTIAGSVSVSVMPPRPFVTPTQAAATVTSGGGLLLAAKASRSYLLIQNNDAAGYICVNVVGAAATLAAGVRIAPGGSAEWTGESIPTAAIYAIGSIASNPNVVVVEG